MRTLSLSLALFALTAHASPAAVPLQEPRIFAPGVVSGPANDGAPAFTPDGNTLFFTRTGASWGFILESHRVHGKWTAPKIAPFSGQWSDLQPAMAPDGSHLIFVSWRPLDGKPHADAPRVANFWRVNRTKNGWSAPVLLPENVRISRRMFKPSIAADGSLYFMAMVGESKNFQLFRAQARNGGYDTPQVLSFSDGKQWDVDPEIAPDESFLVFSSNGRQTGEGQHERLFITFKRGTSWSQPEPLRYQDDDSPAGHDDGEAHLSPDGRTLYFNSGRAVRIDPLRTRAQAAKDFERLNAWDNSNANVWTLSLTPWLEAQRQPSPAAR